MFDNRNAWKAIVSMVAFVCVTAVAIETGKMGVMWWNIVPCLIALDM
jgi:hypothetical protein